MLINDLDKSAKTLIEKLTVFMNASIDSPAQLPAIFGEWWPLEYSEPLSVESTPILPDLETINAVRDQVRGWLLDLEKGLQYADQAMHGTLPNDPGISGVAFDAGVPLVFGTTPAIEFSQYSGIELTYKSHIESGDLRSICGYAVVYIATNFPADRVGVCEIEDCDNLIIDTTSRGQKRRYCGSKRCTAAMNKRHMDKYRAKVAMRGRVTPPDDLQPAIDALTEKGWGWLMKRCKGREITPDDLALAGDYERGELDEKR